MSGFGTYALPQLVRPLWQHYGSLLHGLLRAPVELNERTGTRVRTLPGGTSIGVDLSDRLLPTPGLRRVHPRVAAAEVAWYLSGEQDSTWMTKQAPIWDKFVERIPYDVDDMLPSGDPVPASLVIDTLTGEHSFLGVAAAYGYRWRRHFGRDQIALAIQALRDDESSRRVLVSAWDPATDGLGAVGQRNVPCPAAFTLSVTGGQLHSTMLLRSSDVFVGLPYDVMGHALLMDAIATELLVTPGIATFTLAHAHLYEPHWEMAEECLAQTPVLPEILMPAWTTGSIADHRDEYVARVKLIHLGLAWPIFNPRPEVVT